VLLIFSGKGGPDAALKKILQKQKNPKHYDDLNRAMRTGGQKLCANEMQNFALNHNKEIPKKKNRVNFPCFYSLQEHDSRPLPLRRLWGSSMLSVKRFETLGFFKGTPF